MKNISYKKLNKIIEESLKKVLEDKPYLHFLREGALNEMGMKPTKFSDKFSEIVEQLADDLISICIYSKCLSKLHWKGSAIGLCRRFIAQDIDPKKKNTYEIRKKFLLKGLYEKLNTDFSALEKRIVGVIDYYRHKENPKDRMEPDMDAKTAFLVFGKSISDALLKLVDEIAKENYEGVRYVVEGFNPNEK